MRPLPFSNISVSMGVPVKVAATRLVTVPGMVRDLIPVFLRLAVNFVNPVGNVKEVNLPQLLNASDSIDKHSELGANVTLASDAQL